MKIFTPLDLGSLRFRNRIFVSPMCQYSAVEGLAQPWHLVHLGAFAQGGAALVVAEATGVSPVGRITPRCLGLWSEKHAEALRPVVDFIKSEGALAGIQLAHAGRKASCSPPWEGGQPLSLDRGAWTAIAPSASAYSEKYPVPREMSGADLQEVKAQFVNSAKLALSAGFDVVELHMAHGYLLNSFLSPLSNLRSDSYGGSLENRMRFPVEVARAVRAVWPHERPLFARISAVDWVDGGWNLQDSIVLSRELKNSGVDLIDVSSGGNSPAQRIPVTAGYQVPFAEAIRHEAGIKTGAVGLITDPRQAADIVGDEKADAVFIGREMLRDPHWPLRAAHALGIEVRWPPQYERAKW